MKCLCKLIAAGLALVASLSLAACGGKTPGMTDILNRSFMLTEVNGAPFVSEKIPTIEFRQGFRVSGTVCNSFSGQGEISNGKLFVPSLATTKTFCFDQNLNDLEFTFGNMLMSGAKIVIDDQILTLSGEGHKLKYQMLNYEE